MKKNFLNTILLGIVLAWILSLFPSSLKGEERIQIELYGGISYINPKDFNLLPRSEEQYNDFSFNQRLMYMQGYFVNDLHQINSTFPGGLRLRYWVSSKISFSLAWEGFTRRAETTVEGTFEYVQPTWSEALTKKYDPYLLKLSGYAVLGGLQYRIPVGGQTDLELGAAAGWAHANMNFRSTWAHTVDFQAPGYWDFVTVDGGTLEGDGSGNGFIAQGTVRLTRMLGRRLGLFVEAAGTYCRMQSIKGGGRETRLGIPGESIWEGTWGIKKEEIEMSHGELSLSVPTNYWEEWAAVQRERDFVLNLSGARVVFGICLKL